MKYLALISILFAVTASAEESIKSQINSFQPKNIERLLINKNECSKSVEDQKLEQRGCCSHHDGVCGCSGGHAQCCDGAQSPSCGC